MTQDPPTSSNESQSREDESTNPNPNANPDHSGEGLTTPTTTPPFQVQSQSQSHPLGSQSPHAKPCDLCHTPRDVLIRCRIDESKKWHFVCTGKCWGRVSGGKVDGDETHPLYRYGGMWKNKHEGVSAKIKGRAKVRNKRGGGEGIDGDGGEGGRERRKNRRGDERANVRELNEAHEVALWALAKHSPQMSR